MPSTTWKWLQYKLRPRVGVIYCTYLLLTAIRRSVIGAVDVFGLLVMLVVNKKLLRLPHFVVHLKEFPSVKMTVARAYNFIFIVPKFRFNKSNIMSN